MDPILELVNITKRFPGVTANDGISLALYPGEILALLGENGAGKTTLMNILYGLLRPDAGEIRIRGQARHIASPKDSVQCGIGMVHQHFMLVPTLSVMENIVLGQEPRRGPFLARSAAAARIRQLAEEYQLPVSPDDKIWQLSVGEQQRVEILKMVYRGARILVLDEPTTSLTPQEAEALFAILRGMAARGNSVIFISHKMDEVLALSQRIVVLRQGKVVGNLPARDADEQELAYLMVGRHVVTRVSRPDAPAGGGPVAMLRGLSVMGRHGQPAIDHLDLDLNAGEIVGVAGVDGNGQTELVEVLAGLRPAASGLIQISGRPAGRADPFQRMKLGVAYIPAERRSRGSVPGLSLAANAVLKSHAEPPVSRRGILSRKAIGDAAGRLVADYDIRCASIQAPAGTLSGGNLQKLILGREVSAGPKLLIAEQPTRGLDIGSVEIVRQRILQQRERGAAILYLSTDLDEILAISDRIVVLYRGKIVYECPNEQGASRERIGLAMAGKASG